MEQHRELDNGQTETSASGVVTACDLRGGGKSSGKQVGSDSFSEAWSWSSELVAGAQGRAAACLREGFEEAVLLRNRDADAGVRDSNAEAQGGRPPACRRVERNASLGATTGSGAAASSPPPSRAACEDSLIWAAGAGRDRTRRVEIQ